MRKQTAVEWLFANLNISKSTRYMNSEIFEKAKQMEKEQIDEAYKLGQIVNSLNQSDDDEEQTS